MKRMLRLALALVAAAAATTASAQAPAATGLYYVQVRAGMYLPQSDDLDSLAVNNGFGLDAIFGRRFSPNLAGELGLGWYKAGGDEMDLFGTTMENDLTLMPITASARLIAPLGEFEPYALVGVGLYRATLGSTINDPEFGSFSGDETATGFGLHFGAGAAFQVNQSTSLGFELRYATAEPEFDDGDGGEFGVDVSGILVNAALAFRF
jgi:opacity protein-like surface antigen